MATQVRWSIRTIFGLIIASMGLLGLVQALVSGVIHSNLVLENQRQSVQKLLSLTTNSLFSEVHTKSGIIANQMIEDLSLYDALLGVQRSHLDLLLREKLASLLDRDYSFDQLQLQILHNNTLIGATYRVNDAHKLVTVSCADKNHIKLLAQKTILANGSFGLCMDNNHKLIHVSTFPFANNGEKFLFVVLSSASSILRSVESILGLSVHITTVEGDAIHVSSSWPDDREQNNLLLSKVTVNGLDGKPILSITSIDNLEAISTNLKKARLLVMLLAWGTTLLVITIAIWVLRKTTLAPLRKLTRQLQLLKLDRSRLNDNVSVGGTPEIQALANDFNEMTSELNSLYETLESLAYCDGLTRLPNRHFFDQQLGSMVSYCQSKKGQKFCLFLMDLDRFKSVNDTLGHDVGDKLLYEVAHRFKNVLSFPTPFLPHFNSSTHQHQQNVIARLGGDEFAIILPNIHTVEAASTIANQLVKTIRDPFYIENHELLISISIGIVFGPADGKDKNTLLRKADMAMYHSKKAKREYLFYKSTEDDFGIRQLQLERDLPGTIKNNQLVLFYQPKVDLKKGRLCGTEALLYWLHPELGLISPDHFIPIAEESRMINAMTNWVLDRALNDCAVWQSKGYDMGVSVNLSAVNLHSDAIVDQVKTALARSGVRPQDLILELTESAVMEDPRYAQNYLIALHEMGVQLSLDDFGTGYSSLTYVKKLPIHEIKIDKSFVSDIANDSNDEALVRSVISIASHMGLTVVAEGVEEQETLDLVRVLDCDVAQGYYFSRPLAMGDYLDWLERIKQKDLLQLSNEEAVSVAAIMPSSKASG